MFADLVVERIAFDTRSDVRTRAMDLFQAISAGSLTCGQATQRFQPCAACVAKGDLEPLCQSCEHNRAVIRHYEERQYA